MKDTLDDPIRARGWHIDLKPVSGEDVSTSSMSPDDLEKVLLDSDLRKCGKSTLPADINGANVGSVCGPLVLQVMGFQDVSVPSKFKTGPSNSGSKNRLIMFRLTDGVRECKAIECEPLVALKPKQLLPGMKIRLEGKVVIRYGLLMLTDACFTTLGGRVSSLAEAYEAKQLYGGSERAGNVLKKEDQPPRFQPFDPTRRPRKRDMKNPISQDQGVTYTKKKENSEASSKGSEKDIVSRNNASASSKVVTTLLERMEESSNHPKMGRRGRGRRRNHFDNDDNSKHMTLDEWEASKKNSEPPESSIETDYELAMELQQKFDLEECDPNVIQPGFFYEGCNNGRGRGRHGRRRGRGGHGGRRGHRGRRGGGC